MLSVTLGVIPFLFYRNVYMFVTGICFVYHLLHFYVGSPGVHSMWCYQAYLVAYKLFYYGTRFKVLPSVWGTRILYNHRIVAIHGNVTP